LGRARERLVVRDQRLQSLEPGSDDDVPFSVERGIVPIPRGDAAKGEDVYGVACAYCHGAAHTGVGRLGVAVSILPEDTNLEHMALSLRLQRIVFIEKVRHGSFLGYGGDMPPFSLEQLSDEELSNLLEFLAITGE
jgi:thiosulfate dehydrogenase